MTQAGDRKSTAASQPIFRQTSDRSRRPISWDKVAQSPCQLALCRVIVVGERRLDRRGTLPRPMVIRSLSRFALILRHRRLSLWEEAALQHLRWGKLA